MPDELPPSARHYLGTWAEDVGTAIVLVTCGAILALLPVYPLGVLANEIGVLGSFGVILFPFGELLQWSAKKDLERAGEDVPESWERDGGTIALLDRHFGDLGRTPVREVIKR